MTPEAQRIAIAEFCGVKCSGCGNTGFLKKFGALEYAQIRHSNPVWEERWPEEEPDVKCNHMSLPDYLNDLNAMHDAEKLLLTGNGWKERLAKYSSKLMSVMHDTDFGRIDVAFKNDMVHLRYFTLHATAAQRAEALLQTIDKWTP